MKTPTDSRLEYLFVRYWDDALTPAEASELAVLLAGDQDAVRGFQLLTAQAVAVADLHAVPASPTKNHAERPSRERRWSRRKVLGLFGGALAASAGGVAVSRLWFGTADVPPDANGIRYTGLKGTVTVRTVDGRPVAAGENIPSGSTVVTRGFDSTATLAFSDGSSVQLLGDSVMSVSDGGRVLWLHKGNASAELQPRDDGSRLTLTTAWLKLAGVHGATVSLGLAAKSAEVSVYQGKVSVSDPAGAPMTVVREGESLTVDARGVREQKPTAGAPEEFAWDFAASPPEEWEVGHLADVGGKTVLRCDPWPDPYYSGTVMHQIRSRGQWGRGFFTLVEGSTVRVKYRVRADSPEGQVCICARTKHPHCSDTGMLMYNGGFKAAPGGEWSELRLPVERLLNNNQRARFGAPWVGFLVIFNTYEADVGLEVAEFQVHPPGV